MKGFVQTLALILFYTSLFAQDEAAVPSTVLQQSALFFGAGQIGAAVPMQDPAGFYLNPAQLGYFSRNNNLAVSFMPQKTAWSPASYGVTFQTFSLAAGYNFKEKNENLPLSIGVGFIHNKMDYGSSYESYDSFDCFSIGAGYDYYLQFNAGIAVKSINSSISSRSIVDMRLRTVTASVTAFDFGLMVTAPVTNLFMNNVKYNLNDKIILKPKADVTLGYSLTNVGKEIVYLDVAQSDPIPRTARLGYTIDLGIELTGRRTKINAIDYSFTAEAEDILINRNDNGTFDYQSFLGDISVDQNLIGLKNDKRVVVHKGHIFKLFETLTLTSGRYSGHGYNQLKSNGYGISSEGFFKLLKEYSENAVVSFIADHFVIDFNNANIFVDTYMETNFKTISVSLKGISL